MVDHETLLAELPIEPRAGRSIDVSDPTTGDVLTSVPATSVGDCLAAVERAADAGPGWAATPPRARAEVLRRAFETMVAERDHIAELIQLENGKSRSEADGEVAYASEFFRWFSEEAVRISGDLRMAPSGDKRILVMHEPIGVAVLITPWNFPAAMATRKVAPALAAGCTVVLKPAPETPLTSFYLAGLLHRCGVPDGVVNVVLPEPPGDAVAAMLQHRAVRKLSFTGSTAVGRSLLRLAADRVLAVSMELGGNAPFLVLADADLQVAVEAALVAKMRNVGASCIAANRMYVHEGLADDFVEALGARMAGLTLGFDREPTADVGALVSAAERDKVAQLTQAAVRQGARVVAGGRVPDTPGYFYLPTVLDSIEPGASILDTEVFGPVAPVVRFTDEAAAVGWANGIDAGLMSYVMSADLGHALHVAERLEAGMVAINRGVASDPAAPFGGVKQSGLGREGGFEGVHEYLETKYVAASW